MLRGWNAVEGSGHSLDSLPWMSAMALVCEIPEQHLANGQVQQAEYQAPDEGGPEPAYLKAGHDQRRQP